MTGRRKETFKVGKKYVKPKEEKKREKKARRKKIHKDREKEFWKGS